MEDNLLDKDGAYFKATIDSIEVEGMISVEDNMVFLLQDKKKGSSPRDRRGYIGSWLVHKGTSQNLEVNNVENFIIISPEIKQNFQQLVNYEINRIIKEIIITDESKDIFINAFELGVDFGYKLKK